MHSCRLFALGYQPDVDDVRRRQTELQNAYDDLCRLAEQRKQRLEESLQLHSFYRDAEEEDIWLSEREYFVSSTDYGKDVPTTVLLLNKHKVKPCLCFQGFAASLVKFTTD